VSASRWAVIVTAAGAWIAVFDVGYWVHQYQADSTHNDFAFYYVGAEIGLRDGWSRIYDQGLQDAFYSSLRHGGTAAANLHYVNPPPLAWIITPLTALSVENAYVVWTFVNLGALLLTWWLLAPGAGLKKASHLFAVAAFFPLVWSFINGEVVVVLAALVACSAVLLRARREVAAGLLLGVALAVKPTVVFVIPIALVAAGHWRAAAASAGAAGVLAVTSLVTIGSSGVTEFRHLAALAQNDPGSYSTTIKAVLGPGAVAIAAEVLLATAAVAAAWRHRRGDSGLAMSAGILGSLLAAPYLHPYDLTLLLVAGWLQVPAADRWLLAWFGFGWLAAEIVGAGKAYPILVFELAWLALFFVRPTRPVPAIAGRARAG
jgi:glycosyl transferase family 87